ncbi:MAG: C40 family peptidase [Muribaculaceae bacterium]|nr:C40 family peptidase [Muribaculaceae bacterium]
MKLKSIILASLLLCVSAAFAAVEPNDVLKDLKNKIAPDKRTAIWDDVKAVLKGDMLTIEGTVGTIQQKEAISRALNAKDITNFKNNVKVLETTLPKAHMWALVKLSVASLRCEGKHSAEMATQAVMGTPVKVLEQDGDWYRVQTPDRYISYVPESSLQFMNEPTLNTWKKAQRCIVTVYDSRLVAAPGSDETVTDLVLGCILEYKGTSGKWVQLATPDGRTGYAPVDDVQALPEWAKQNFNVALIEKTARRMLGSGYLWGGTSTKVTDCSGLMKVCYFANGIILQRDASQQALTGLRFNDWHQAQTGDLLFFGNAKTKRVTHVGMYLRDGKYIHCSGQVKINSLEPNDPTYLYSPLSCSRINGQIGKEGIIYVRNHPWYF